MAGSNSFQQEHHGVALRMAAGPCVTVLISATCLYRGAAAPTTLAERLIVTARADVFVLCWLAAAIAGSGSGTASAEVDRAKAVLQNTLEQVVLAVLIHVALAVLVGSSVPFSQVFRAPATVGNSPCLDLHACSGSTNLRPSLAGAGS